MRSQSPLRYPGSKPNLADYFETFLKENLLWGTDLVEPYAGSASLAIALLRRGAIRRATLVERDPLLYALWRQLKDDPAALCARIRRMTLTMAAWRRRQRALEIERPTAGNILELAAACIFLNRANFSGILHAKPIGGVNQKSQYKIDCRFNSEALCETISGLADVTPQMTVVFGDAVSYLKRRHDALAAKGTVVYVDPPYYAQGRKLYRYHYVDSQHRALAELLYNARFKWLVSYDNHPFIRRLFKDQSVVPIWLNYVVKQSRKAEELLISNCRLLPVTYTADPKSTRASA